MGLGVLSSRITHALLVAPDVESIARTALVEPGKIFHGGTSGHGTVSGGWPFLFGQAGCEVVEALFVALTGV